MQAIDAEAEKIKDIDKLTFTLSAFNIGMTCFWFFVRMLLHSNLDAHSKIMSEHRCSWDFYACLVRRRLSACMHRIVRFGRWPETFYMWHIPKVRFVEINIRHSP